MSTVNVNNKNAFLFLLLFHHFYFIFLILFHNLAVLLIYLIVSFMVFSISYI